MLVAAVALTAGVAQAQNDPNRETLSEKGTFQGSSGNSMKVLLNSEPWLIELQPPDTKVSVTGEAEPDFLRPGLHIKFSGELDKKGTALAKEIESVEIFTPAGKGGIGAFESADAEAKPIAKPADGTTYEFRTKVGGYKPGELTVVIGGKKIVAKTSENFSVTVNTGDLSLVSEGDAVTITGWYNKQEKPNAQNMQPGYGHAQSVSVKLGKRLAPTKKAKVAKAPRARRPHLPLRPRWKKSSRRSSNASGKSWVARIIGVGILGCAEHRHRQALRLRAAVSRPRMARDPAAAGPLLFAAHVCHRACRMPGLGSCARVAPRWAWHPTGAQSLPSA